MFATQTPSTATATATPPRIPSGVASATAAQQTFRRVLDALARPGQVQQLASDPSLSSATFADQPHLAWPATLLLMLVDHEVSLAVAGVAGGEALETVVRRRTRVATATPEAADTVVCDGGALTPELVTALKRGSLEYPDDGATLLVLTDDLTTATAGAPTATLSGPGIDGAIRVSLPGLDPDILAAREDAIALYPMGIDILLLDRAGRLLGLPRTTVVTLGSQPASPATAISRKEA